MVLDFLYFPDENRARISIDVLKENIIPRYFPRYKGLICQPLQDSYSSVFAPFESITEGITERFPVGLYRAICGSTGLCSGNTKSEAIVQGINEMCELFIRYAMMII